MSSETLNADQIRYENKVCGLNSKPTVVQNVTHTNMYLGTQSQNNGTECSIMPKIIFDANRADNSLSVMRNSQTHHSQTGNESDQPLNSTFERKQNETAQDKCIVDSSEQVNGTKLSFLSPSYESVVDDDSDCALR